MASLRQWLARWRLSRSTDAAEPAAGGATCRHLAIIMDGNGRWAQRRRRARIWGHRAGVGSVRAVSIECARLGIQRLTLYAFSQENWKRPEREVSLLWKLLRSFLVRERRAGRLELPLAALPEKRALLHGHCHQKAFGAMGAVERALRLVPELKVSVIESSCCGMAGSFGYEGAHYEVSMKMAEASLLPRVRRSGIDEVIVADGTSCRHQITDGARRGALHVARLLEKALA